MHSHLCFFCSTKMTAWGRQRNMNGEGRQSNQHVRVHGLFLERTEILIVAL